MRLSVIAGVFACTLVFAASSSKAGASTTSTLKINDSGIEIALLTQKVSAEDIKVSDKSTSLAIADEAPKEPKIIKHKIEKSESLSVIAKKYNTTWKRIFDKNTNIVNPDIINPGEELVIPANDEELEPRELPQMMVTTRQTETNSTYNNSSTQTQSTVSRGSSSGNGYVAGYCTWYVKNMRPDLPNNLGNAYTWYSRAASQGMAVGSTPRVGAVGQRGNHVVYVQSVNTDGTVTISEMNHKGLYVKTVRTLPANYFRYIY